MREVYRRTPSPELAAAAHHESGHCIAILQAFRTAAWLPRQAPQFPVRFVQIEEVAPGEWVGDCTGANIYSTEWPVDVLVKPYRDLMERQTVIHLAGGVSEAVFRGERRRGEVLAFATRHCCIDADLEQARAVLGDLFRVTGYRFRAEDFVDRTLAMLSANWCSVTALAEALIERRRIEGAEVEEIIHSIGSASS